MRLTIKKDEPIEQREKAFYDALIPYVEKYGKQMVRNFFDYWSEKTASGKTMRWERELEKKGCFDLDKRLSRWYRFNFDKTHDTEKLRETELRNINERSKRERATAEIGNLIGSLFGGETMKPVVEQMNGGYAEYIESLRKKAAAGDERAKELLERHTQK